MLFLTSLCSLDKGSKTNMESKGASSLSSIEILKIPYGEIISTELRRDSLYLVKVDVTGINTGEHEVLVRVDEGQVADYSTIWASELDHETLKSPNKAIQAVYEGMRAKGGEMVFEINTQRKITLRGNTTIELIKEEDKDFIEFYLAIRQQTKAREKRFEQTKVRTSLYVFPDMGIKLFGLLKLKLELAIPRQNVVISLSLICLFYIVFFTAICGCFKEYRQIMTAKIPENVLELDTEFEKEKIS
ncbi:unnamed protein product [Moneuplotes crassus]|uniref:Uncharacterized protein n=1 Tax=Euplotes crassus TaxID=5936 RepID=A0AAD2D2U3_EUPCR|nr:unnamed protein product [Moneuplotes crassus]